VHLASPRAFDRDSVLTTDIMGTGQLIDSWRKGPFLYLSSTTVHGVPHAPLNEASPIDVTDWYDMGKYCNEMQLALARGSGARGHGIALRPALIFSTNGRRYDHHIIGDMFRRCKRIHTAVFESEEALETIGGSYIGGADFGRAVAEALTMTASGPFTLAGDFQTWRHWIETINKHAGTKVKLEVRPGAQLQPGEWKPPHSRTCLDYSAFKAQTGFEPRQSFDELVQEFVERDRADKVL
jgi:nucleoside-diphosphate-sugar epimerase